MQEAAASFGGVSLSTLFHPPSHEWVSRDGKPIWKMRFGVRIRSVEKSAPAGLCVCRHLNLLGSLSFITMWNAVWVVLPPHPLHAENGATPAASISSSMQTLLRRVRRIDLTCICQSVHNCYKEILPLFLKYGSSFMVLMQKPSPHNNQLESLVCVLRM